MHALSHLIARTRSQLINWRVQGLNSIESDLLKTKHEINIAETNDVSNDYNDFSQNSLPILYNKYSALQKQNSIKWAQRARFHWVNNGDFNTSFFHNSVSVRNHVNNISHISDCNGSLSLFILILKRSLQVFIQSFGQIPLI